MRHYRIMRVWSEQNGMSQNKHIVCVNKITTIIIFVTIPNRKTCNAK